MALEKEPGLHGLAQNQTPGAIATAATAASTRSFLSTQQQRSDQGNTTTVHPFPPSVSAQSNKISSFNQTLDALQHLLAFLKSKNNTASSSSPSSSPQYMRACMIVRDDNYYLAEWVAYHYTVLPLRHLIVGCDYGSTQDPMEILGRWNHTDLQYQVWHPERFFPRTRRYRSNDTKVQQVQRQSVFLSKCMQYLHEHDPNGWVALVDPDEFIKLNPLEDALNHELYELNTPWKMDPKEDAWLQAIVPFLVPQNETILDRITARKQMRQRLGLEKAPLPPPTTLGQKLVRSLGIHGPPTAAPTSATVHPKKSLLLSDNASSYLTVLRVLEDYSSQHGTLPCHTMSRRRYSAVMDNFDHLAQTICRPTLDARILAGIAASSNVSRLSTIQFLYPDPIEEWSKVLVDLRRLPLSTIEKRRNPHRPLDECAAPLLLNVASLIEVNHYVNHWHVYRRRKGDSHSSLARWSQSAHQRQFALCDQMHGWLNEFVQQFGMQRAMQLLLDE